MKTSIGYQTPKSSKQAAHKQALSIVKQLQSQQTGDQDPDKGEPGKSSDRVLQFFLEYEIFGSWWAGYIPGEKLQNLVAAYFCWKVRRKYNRYIDNKRITRKTI